MAASPAPARADTFQAASAPPVVTIVSVPDQPFQPGYTNSSWGPGGSDGANTLGSGDYEIDVSVAEANGVDDVEDVSLCVFEISHESECSPSTDEGPDPRWAMLLTWTRPAEASLWGAGRDGFAKVGTNNYALSERVVWGDQVATYDDGSFTGWVADRFHTYLRFTFAVSDAMHADCWWRAKAIATNTSSQSNSGQGEYDNVSVLGVSYFGWVTTARQGLDYGTLEGTPGDPGWTVRTGSLGSFVANATSSIYLQSEDFTYTGALSSDGPATIELQSEAVDPEDLASGQARLDCTFGDDFDPAAVNFTAVTDVPSPVAYEALEGGTGESGDATLTDTCRLLYAGGAPVTKVSYEAYVWVGIGPMSSPWGSYNPLSGALPGQDTNYVVTVP